MDREPFRTEPLTVEDVHEDLISTNDMSVVFAYGVNAVGELIAEQYSADGNIVARFVVTVSIEPVPVINLG